MSVEALSAPATWMLRVVVGVLAALLAFRAGLEPRLPEGVLVQVVGAVPRPGVRLSEATVGAAVRAAGGRSERSDPLPPGSRVEVRPEGMHVAVADDPWLLGQPIDINLAGAVALTSLPGVGPATAAALLDHRQAKGPFATVGALVEVRGIGPATLARVAPFLTVTGPSSGDGS